MTWKRTSPGGVAADAAGTAIADNVIVRGSGTSIQGTGITCDDSDNVTLPDGADLTISQSDFLYLSTTTNWFTGATSNVTRVGVASATRWEFSVADLLPWTTQASDVGSTSKILATVHTGGINTANVTSAAASYTADNQDRRIHLTHATPTLVLPAATAGTLELILILDNAGTITPDGADTADNTSPVAGTWLVHSDLVSNWDMVQIA